MNQLNLVSVIIPVYNCEKYIGEAIQSVINQSFKPFQIIVIDDGSTDNSSNIAKSYSEIEYYYQDNQGPFAALNFGLNKVKGNLIAFLDSDDIWASNKLELQTERLAEDNSIEAVFGYHKRFYTRENKEITKEETADSKRILPAYFKGAMLIKKDSFNKVGLFDESLKMGDFIDWFSRAKNLDIKMDIIKAVVHYRRIHDSNYTLKNKSEINDFVKVIKASIDRKRMKNK